MSRRCGRAAFISISISLVIAPAMLRAQEKQEEEESNIELQRQQWFYGQRAYPHPYVPGGAHQRSVNELRQKMAAEAAAGKAANKPLVSPAWTSIGPQPIDTPYTDPVVSGRVTAIRSEER